MKDFITLAIETLIFFWLFFSPPFLQSTEQVAAFCRSLHDMNSLECVSSSPSPESPFPPPATPRQLSDADKLRKVICELVETERTYVKVSITHLTCRRQMVFVSVHVPPVHRSIFLSALGRVRLSHYPFNMTYPYLSLCLGRYEQDTAVPLLGYCLIFFSPV